MANGLLREDFHTPAWRRLSEFLGARLSELRQQNDRNVDERETALIRGSISEVKRILALAENVSASGVVRPGELTGEDSRGGWPADV